MNFENWEILRGLRKKFLDTVEMALVIGTNGENALLATSDGRVYGVGTNTSGCLGFNNSWPQGLPSEMELSRKGIKGLVYGGNGSDVIFLVAHLNSEELFCWGRVPFPLNTSLSSLKKMSIDSKIRVKTVACGALHCAVLSDDGKVFTCGRSDSSQLGHSEALSSKKIYESGNSRDIYGTSKLSRVKSIIENQIVTDISCGYDFTVVLLDNGRVVAWGKNDYGQLGICRRGNSPVFLAEVVSLSTYYEAVIEKIVCGRCHVLALTKTGTLYAWGDNSYGQLGIPNNPYSVTGCPVEIEVNELQSGVADIGASYLHNISVAQCKNGKVYHWGDTARGNVMKPTEAVGCESIDDVFVSLVSPKIMVRPMRRLENSQRVSRELEATQEMTLFETLKNEFNNPDSSDMTVVVGEMNIYVHQYILKTRSKYFNALISRWLEENERDLKIKEKSYAAIEAYLKYLYTDKVEADLNLAVELLQLADEYGDQNLKSLSQNIILREMKSDGAADIFADTRKIENCKKLNRVSLEVALRNAKELIDSPGFERWDLDTMKDFVREYVRVKGNCL